MTIDEVFEKLRSLQEILSRKFELEGEIEQIPRLLSAQEELLARLKKTFIERNKEYDAVKAQEAEFRQLLKEAETARETAEKNIELASTQREYEARDKEITDAKEKEHRYRKELLQMESRLADMKEQVKESAAMIKSQETELAERRAGVAAEETEKKARLAEMERESTALTEGLDGELLFKFERIIKNKGGKGIVPIKGGVCTGCHMIVPAQFANNVRSGEDILFCPYCSRILYYDESASSDEADYIEEDTGSLSDLEDLDDEDDEESDDDDDEGGLAAGMEFDE